MIEERKIHENKELPLVIRRSARARRISLKIDTKARQGILVLPVGISEIEGLDFAEQHREWLNRQLAELPIPIPFADGATIPFLGNETVIQHGGQCRGIVEVGEKSLTVFGRPEHLARRLTDWLKRQARTEISRLVAEKSAQLGRKAGRITIRDQKTRWGSCAVSGNLTFNWRLILAPKFVLDYVVAHEVAHLAEHNHSANFWAIVATLTEHSEPGRAWLRRHGSELHRYG
ncbi:MAG: hypothetical protein CMM48_06460 [Rhodospirillaceae bacterium]|mgnify:CR=1 FL=1|nr:hypothetical protein [Rhodospirillaceae bacterium]HAA90872.1 M48 family peptidase [Rhodospirillaceae bacterium]